MAFFDSPDKFKCDTCEAIDEIPYKYPERAQPRDCVDKDCPGMMTLFLDFRPQDHAHIRPDNSELSDQWYYTAEEQGLTD